MPLIINRMPSPPSINGEPKIVQKGGDVVLECEVQADPKPDIKWAKDDKDIAAGPHYTMADTPKDGNKYAVTCTIVNFNKSLAGIYKATFKNSGGEVHSTFTVSAGDAPDMPEKPKIVQRDGGKVLAIKIMAESKTEPSISWTKNDKMFDQSDRVKFVTKKDEKEPTKYTFFLEITGPQPDDAAKYTCIVKNKDGSNSQSLNLAFD